MTERSSDLVQRDPRSITSPARDSGGESLRAPAAASLVNRTHRVIRERAKSQIDRRSRFRSLSIPLAICSALLIVISIGAWNALAQTDLSPTGIPDASDQMLVFLLWFFPVSAALLTMVWFKRNRIASGNESAQ